MRWSMVPVSAAAHVLLLVALLFNPVTSVDLPAPWQTHPLAAYVAAAALPTPPLERSVPAARPPAGAPTHAPEGISRTDVAPPPSDDPGVEGGLPDTGVGTTAGVPAGFGASLAGPAPEPPPAPDPPKIVRIGGAIREPRKIVQVPPVYPEIARAARVQGLVVVEATISEDGSVDGARVLRSVPLLDGAALAAVKQWRYTPTLLNGVPVRVLMTITFNFRLGDPAP